jgi:hypothetical protein
MILSFKDWNQMAVEKGMGGAQTTCLTVLFLAIIIGSNAVVGIAFPGFISPMKFPAYSDIFIATALCLCALPLFAFARFSFGYLVGLYMYAMVAGYIFLSYSTKLQYDHSVGRLSAVLSLLAFLIPALFLRPDLRSWTLSPRAMDRLLILILFTGAAVLALSASYGFRFAGVLESIAMRSEITRPRFLNYMTSMLTCAVLPFTFAYFATNRKWLLAACAALLIACFFPILLNKTVLFTPIWLIYLYLMYRIFNPIVATVLVVALPVLVGAATYLAFYNYYFVGFVNLRMVAIPSLAMDHYLDFFSTRPNTYFCQIGLVRAIVDCPYAEQLGVLLEREYHLGNFNGSLFTTEGIASLGPYFAPVATFFCGVVIGLGNVASSRLPLVLVCVSSSVVVQSLLNVPLSTVMLSNGGAVMFLLWMVSPRASQQSS